MEELPEKFPEYSIMYKTLTKQIKVLEQRKAKETEVEEIKLKIQRYELEKIRIEKMFPDSFFEGLN